MEISTSLAGVVPDATAGDDDDEEDTKDFEGVDWAEDEIAARYWNAQDHKEMDKIGG